MNSFIQRLCILLFLFGTSAQAETPLPQPFEAEYLVSKAELNIGSSIMRLVRQGDHWQFSTETRATGMMKLLMPGAMREYSEFRMSDNGLRLQRYRFSDERKPKRNIEAHCDWDSGTLNYRYRGQDGSLPLAGVDTLHDRLSANITVMRALQAGGETLEISAFDGNEIKAMRFAISPGEALETPLGPQATLQVERLRGDQRRRTLTWYAPQLGYVPVKIEQYKKGELVARMTLQKLQLTAPALQ